jgi:ABC-2 type transport system permease protein
MPIFDQGYQHWSGTLTGHSWRWLTIARHGYRNGMKNSFLRVMLMLAWLPAIGFAVFLAVWGLVEQRSPIVQPLLPFLSFLGPDILADPKSYRVEVWTLSYSYFLSTELYFSMILILMVGPSLISQDIRFNALPLYFSRPLRRIDYFLGKLGVIGAFLGLVLIVPSLVAYGLGLLFSLDISILADTFRLLIACVAYGLIMTLSAGMLILALSSLSRNSRYIGLFWVGAWFVTGITGTFLVQIHHEQRMSETFRKSYEAERAAEKQRALEKQDPRMTFQEMQRKQALEQQRQRKAAAKLYSESIQEELDDAKTDWRQMVSYTANLSRVGDAILGTNSCWQRLSKTKPEEQRTEYLLKNMDPQYPWYWSATVLIVLFGISVCILNFRVKSLDHLR